MSETNDLVSFQLKTATGKPIPSSFIEQVERVLADAREGKVTSMAWCAIGPDFAKWDNAHMADRQDRISLIGQLAILQQEISQVEIDSE